MGELVSVIVPMYNHAQFVEQCLDSVYNEDYPNIELIIIDDGSKDNSLEIATKWRESHPGKFTSFHIETQQNQGICKTLNRLIALSNGEFICLLASDDFLFRGYIKARVESLKNRGDWLAVMGDATLVNPRGKVLSTSVIKLAKINTFALKSDILRENELIFNWNVPLSIMFFRKQCFGKEGIGLYDETLMFEDRDFCLRLLSKKACGFVDCNLYAYRSRLMDLSPQISSATPGLDAEMVWRSYHQIEFRHHSSFSGIGKVYLYLSKYNSPDILSKIIKKLTKTLVKSVYSTKMFITRVRLGY